MNCVGCGRCGCVSRGVGIVADRGFGNLKGVGFGLGRSGRGGVCVVVFGGLDLVRRGWGGAGWWLWQAEERSGVR